MVDSPETPPSNAQSPETISLPMLPICVKWNAIIPQQGASAKSRGGSCYLQPLEKVNDRTPMIMYDSGTPSCVEYIKSTLDANKACNPYIKGIIISHADKDKDHVGGFYEMLEKNAHGILDTVEFLVLPPTFTQKAKDILSSPSTDKMEVQKNILDATQNKVCIGTNKDVCYYKVGEDVLRRFKGVKIEDTKAKVAKAKVATKAEVKPEAKDDNKRNETSIMIGYAGQYDIGDPTKYYLFTGDSNAKDIMSEHHNILSTLSKANGQAEPPKTWDMMEQPHHGAIESSGEAHMNGMVIFRRGFDGCYQLNMFTKPDEAPVVQEKETPVVREKETPVILYYDLETDELLHDVRFTLLERGMYITGIFITSLLQPGVLSKFEDYGLLSKAKFVYFPTACEYDNPNFIKFTGDISTKVRELTGKPLLPAPSYVTPTLYTLRDDQATSESSNSVQSQAEYNLKQLLAELNDEGTCHRSAKSGDITWWKPAELYNADAILSISKGYFITCPGSLRQPSPVVLRAIRQAKAETFARIFSLNKPAKYLPLVWLGFPSLMRTLEEGIIDGVNEFREFIEEKYVRIMFENNSGYSPGLPNKSNENHYSAVQYPSIKIEDTTIVYEEQKDSVDAMKNVSANVFNGQYTFGYADEEIKGLKKKQQRLKDMKNVADSRYKQYEKAIKSGACFSVEGLRCFFIMLGYRKEDEKFKQELESYQNISKNANKSVYEYLKATEVLEKTSEFLTSLAENVTKSFAEVALEVFSAESANEQTEIYRTINIYKQEWTKSIQTGLESLRQSLEKDDCAIKNEINQLFYVHHRIHYIIKVKSKAPNDEVDVNIWYEACKKIQVGNQNKLLGYIPTVNAKPTNGDPDHTGDVPEHTGESETAHQQL